MLWRETPGELYMPYRENLVCSLSAVLVKLDRLSRLTTPGEAGYFPGGHYFAKYKFSEIRSAKTSKQGARRGG